MKLLNDAPLSLCFELGLSLWRVDAIIALRSDLKADWDWTTNVEIVTRVALAVKGISNMLAPYLLSEPAHDRLRELKKAHINARTLLKEVQGRLVAIDLLSSPERARWLIAGWQLGRLESLESSGDGAARVRSQIDDFETWSSEELRTVASTLDPERIPETLQWLELLRVRHPSEWVSVVSLRAGQRDLVASSTPLVDPPPTEICAWSPVQVFLSHSSKDKRFVRRIDSQLRAHATVDVYLDERNLTIGDELDETLRAAISKADFLLAVC